MTSYHKKTRIENGFDESMDIDRLWNLSWEKKSCNKGDGESKMEIDLDWVDFSEIFCDNDSIPPYELNHKKNKSCNYFFHRVIRCIVFELSGGGIIRVKESHDELSINCKEYSKHSNYHTIQLFLCDCDSIDKVIQKENKQSSWTS